jgi:hypothetical protein
MKIIFIIVALFVNLGCGNQIEEKKEVPIPVDNEVIKTDEIPAKNSPQSIRKIRGEEKNKINIDAKDCILFLNYYLPLTTEPTLNDLDSAFKLWQKSKEKVYTAKQVQQMLGSYFGNYCVNTLNMEWVFIEDGYGKDFAVQSKEFVVMTFPFSSIQKRIDDGENDFINSLYFSTKNQLSDNKSKRKVK